jgi:hypothetical protein
MSFYTCFDWLKKLRVFVNERNLKIDVVLTNFNENRSRTPMQNQLKISCNSIYFFVFIMPPPLGDGGITFYRPFIKKWFLCNNIAKKGNNKITELRTILQQKNILNCN